MFANDLNSFYSEKEMHYAGSVDSRDKQRADEDEDGVAC